MRLHGNLRIGALRLSLFLLPVAAVAACASFSVSSDGADSNLMLRGDDPVGYFTVGMAMRGRPELKVEHRGVIYRFANETNRRLFLASPEKYAPQFGGFCAERMVYAEPVPASSDVFKIIDGRLYLFESGRAKRFFEMDQERNLRLAWHYWETEVRDSSWRLQAWKRLLFRVPNYKSDAELGDEYQRRFGRRPG
jgi:YHS domain-containing protein